MHVDPHYIKMLLSNLLGNAQLYAKSCISITTDLSGDFVLMTIADDGPGIPEVERENIIKPFVRGLDKGQPHGHGMGLAIVARIAQWHGVQLHIGESQELGGAEFLLTFPAYKSRHNF